MADYSYPSGFPTLQVDGYSETAPKLALRTEVEIGEPKARQFATANVRPISGKLFLTAAQKATFKTFFETTLAGGVYTFAGTPGLVTEYAGEDMMFIAEPTYEPAGLDWLVSISVLVLP